MGSYLNPNPKGFQESLRSKIYIDKSMLIASMNELINTEQKYICLSRPRRFGKSMAADMLLAYYGKNKTADLFEHLKIANVKSYKEHLNQYDVIKINMQEFLSVAKNVDEMLDMIKKYILFDLFEQYDTIRYRDEKNMIQVMKDIFAKTNKPFVILIDEWDCMFREYVHDIESQKKYLDFLRVWLKDQDYVALAYMTGILPVKKYGTHSALNMFMEYSMTDPGQLAEFFGFTEEEVRGLCAEYDMSFDETRAWYDGYELVTNTRKGEIHYSMYSPKSVVEAMLRQRFATYWNQTETYEALKMYIQMNLDGLKDAVIEMIAGKEVEINTGTFANDMTTFANRDDVLTLLVHLGYLSYRWSDRTVSIPNKEVSLEYINAVSMMDWGEVMRSVNASRRLLQSLWNMDEKAVARGVDQVHDEISILQYNDENSLSCTIHLAFYFAREYYTIVRELPSGKGFADICLIPRKLYADKPAVVIELKMNQDVQGAISQIKRKEYVKSLADYQGNMLLVGINYDKKTKVHQCVIERYEKFPGSYERYEKFPGS